MNCKFLAIGVASILFASNAFASSVSESQGAANNLVTAAATPVASSATAGIIASGVSGALGGAIPTVNASGTRYLDTRALTGVSAGGLENKAGAWIQGGYTIIKGTDDGGKFDGNVYNLVGGFDYKFRDNAVAGLSIAYENVDVDTTFNNGTFKGKGITVAPYAGYVFGSGVTVDAMLGMTFLSYDVASTATGSFDAKRYMASANISKAFKTSKFTITPKLGVLQVHEKQDAYVDSVGTDVEGSKINLGRASFGFTAALNDEKFSPYIRAMGEYDYKKGAAADLGNGNLASNDKLGINAAIGINAKLNDKASINVEATSQANLRDNLNVYGVTGRLRLNF